MSLGVTAGGIVKRKWPPVCKGLIKVKIKTNNEISYFQTRTATRQHGNHITQSHPHQQGKKKVTYDAKANQSKYQ